MPSTGQAIRQAAADITADIDNLETIIDALPDKGLWDQGYITGARGVVLRLIRFAEDWEDENYGE